MAGNMAVSVPVAKLFGAGSWPAVPRWCSGAATALSDAVAVDIANMLLLLLLR